MLWEGWASFTRWRRVRLPYDKILKHLMLRSSPPFGIPIICGMRSRPNKSVLISKVLLTFLFRGEKQLLIFQGFGVLVDLIYCYGTLVSSRMLVKSIASDWSSKVWYGRSSKCGDTWRLRRKMTCCWYSLNAPRLVHKQVYLRGFCFKICFVSVLCLI